MNGPAIFNFTAKAVPELIKNTLEKNNESLESMDQFIFIRLILLC
jgi:3-oxoacyl-[acyl-carrier-protein] synthase-3